MFTVTATNPKPTTTLSVTELFAGIDRGDQDSWGEIVRRYSPIVLGKVRSFRMQEADACDAVQLTWLRLAENWRKVDDPERLGGWLATTARHECLGILRRTRRLVPGVDIVENQVDPAAGPEQHAIDAETARIVRSAVAELPIPRRDLVVALFVDDPSPYTELSRRVGIPIGSIGPTRARILRHLKRLLAERGLAA